MIFYFVNIDEVDKSVIEAYSKLIQFHGHQVSAHSNSRTVPSNASLVWWFCGHVSPTEANRLCKAFHVHEYYSASYPPYSWVKDQLKHWTHPRPDFRIYQSSWLRERLAFTDDVPHGFRDPGLAEYFFEPSTLVTTPEFDFVYTGDLLHLLTFKNVLQAIYEAGRSLLIIGEIPTELRALLTPNITYIESLKNMELPHHFRRAQFGLNLVPNINPFNQQASSNLLAYCAVGLRVVTNSYPWVRYFMAHHNANFYLLPDGSTSLATNFGKGLDAFPYVSPDINHLCLHTTIKKLPIWKTITLL